MPKWLKMALAILLLPVCYGALRAVVRVISATGSSELSWIALAGGMGCWLAVYLLLPRPFVVYVFGHELTHVVWTWLFGGRVKRFKVGRRGGHVHVSKSNFLIALAPYFFPIYGVLVIAVFVLGNLVWDWSGYVVWFHWLVGVAYGFHVTFTWRILLIEQSDITSQGVFFSAVIIVLGNLVVLLLGLPWLSKQVNLAMALGWWFQETGAVVVRLGHVLAIP